MTWDRDPRLFPRAIVHALVRDAATRRHLWSWLGSFRASADLLAEGRPWLPFVTLDWLQRILRPDMQVFEWGCGGSTVFLAGRVAQVVSVEHDPAWHGQVADELARRDFANCRPVLAPPDPVGSTGGDREFVSTHPGFAGMNFARYATAIDAYPDGHFDLIVVDGRQRVACARRAIAKIRTGGHLLLDDSNRRAYRKVHDLLAHLPSIEFRGLGPLSVRAKRSTAWRLG